jgi:hypothetical protein
MSPRFTDWFRPFNGGALPGPLFRIPPVTGDVSGGPGQLGELADLAQHQDRVGQGRGVASAALPLARVHFGTDRSRTSVPRAEGTANPGDRGMRVCLARRRSAL